MTNTVDGKCQKRSTLKATIWKWHVAIDMHAGRCKQMWYAADSAVESSL